MQRECWGLKVLARVIGRKMQVRNYGTGCLGLDLGTAGSFCCHMLVVVHWLGCGSWETAVHCCTDPDGSFYCLRRRMTWCPPNVAGRRHTWSTGCSSWTRSPLSPWMATSVGWAWEMERRIAVSTVQRRRRNLPRWLECRKDRLRPFLSCSARLDHCLITFSLRLGPRYP
jgi:hypothetical protein